MRVSCCHDYLQMGAIIVAMFWDFLIALLWPLDPAGKLDTIHITHTHAPGNARTHTVLLFSGGGEI